MSRPDDPELQGAPTAIPAEARPLRWRYERFGGIVASESPPILAFLNRAFMRTLGLEGSRLWVGEDDGEIGLLSAPTEVHMATTGICAAGCDHCYMDAGEAERGELGTEEMERTLG